MTPQELQKVLDELEASRSSRKRAWENLQRVALGSPGCGWAAVAATGQKDDSRQNSLLLLVVLDSDFDTPLWDFLSQILQPGILAQNRPSRVAVLTPNPTDPKNNFDSEVQMRLFGRNQEYEARAWLLSFATPHCLPPILG
jgi:hypothetical protein